MTQPIDAGVRAALSQARGAIDGGCTRDRARLIGLWRRWSGQPGDAGMRTAFEAALAQSVAGRTARAATLPRAQVDANLPIFSAAEEITRLITGHQVVVIAGETGSGKTTQIPKLCLAAGRGAAGMIGCTQPRRIAARAVARRVAEELQVPLGGTVGFQVRFNDNVGSDTAIKFMTDGILLAEVQSDRWLSAYDTIIIDEAHERSLNIDFLLGYLKTLLPQRPDLKLIVTSATIDTARFSQHFGDAPVVDVAGRGFPVEVRWRPLDGPLHGDGGAGGHARDDGRDRNGEASLVDSAAPEDGGARSVVDGIVAACDEIARDRSGGDTLVFLPGEREIRDVHQALERRKYRHTEVLPLYARLSVKDQDRVFNPGSLRRIVLATNVAETSLTVPRIHYVVDPGLARIKRYSPRQKLDRLHIEPVSQASANQRMGRCGRIAPGICYRLYSEGDFDARVAFTDPEIRRAALAGVILRMLSLGLGQPPQKRRTRDAAARRGADADATRPRANVPASTGRGGTADDVAANAPAATLIEDFPFLEPPDPRAIADGWQTLLELGAVDAQRALTPIGRTLARLPVDAKLARMLVAAQQHGCLGEMIAIASFLGIQDPRERPSDQRAAADNAHARFADPKSEFVGILRLWQAYRTVHAESTQSQLRKWCERSFLGFLRMREWRELHRQLKLQCADIGWPTGDGDDIPDGPLDARRYAALHRALLAGLPTQVGQRGDRGVFEGPRGRRFQLFPGSTLASRPPTWVLSATLLDTEKVWALTNAAIEADWVIAELPHLLARRHHDPHWSRAQGRVVGSEQISLFGLVLAPKRPIHYGGLYPEESRGIFVRDGLVTGEIDTRSNFVARNLATLEAAREEEAKQRRSGLVVDEDWQARWYLDRIPAPINSVQGLDAWYGKLPPAQQRALAWSREDLLVGEGADSDRFPAYLALGDVRLAVRYRFEPGAIDDGMTVAVPLHLLNALDPARLSWLAPGFVADKAVAAIKTLPKALRRNVVPAPDFARAFAQAWTQPREPAADDFIGTLARFLQKLTGADIPRDAFDEAALEPHLRANLRLFDVDGKQVLAESRDLDDLRARFGARAAQAFAAHAAQGMERDGLRTFPDAPVPLSVPGVGGVPAYPALHDDGDSVSLAVHADAAQAHAQHPRGVRRLLAIALADKVKQARKQLPAQPKTALLYAAIESSGARAAGGGPGLALSTGDRLRDDLVDGAFAALAAEGLGEIRDADAFAARRDALSRGLFGEAMLRLSQAEAILALVGEVRARLDSKLVGWARANLDDMQAQLRALAHPGFLRDTPGPVLAEYPRYLKALALRAERALRDPVRDQQRMLEIKPFIDALDEHARQQPLATVVAPEWQALRWDLEELRVSLFAQELGARGGVSPKKLATRLAQLRG